MGGRTRTKVRQPPSSAKHHYSEQHQPVRTSSPQVHHADPVPCAGTWGWRGSPALWRGEGAPFGRGEIKGLPDRPCGRIKAAFPPSTSKRETPMTPASSHDSDRLSERGGKEPER